MGLKKKKNIVVLTLCMVTSFILYQLYFFLTITSETSNNNRVIPILDGSATKHVVHRSGADKFINEKGVIRGVLPHFMVRYRPDSNNQFKCLNSEELINFDWVNDDYCDCEDGTDEPSTNACANGIFHCNSFQKKPVTSRTDSVPSSRVNDGICDCCDGSDEWIYVPIRKVLTLGSAQFYRQHADICGNVC